MGNIANELRKLVPTDKKVVFACVGTDRSTGDSLGPLVGTKLQTLGYLVIGTLDNPLHAENLSDRLKELPQNAFVVAVDACLGKFESIGRIDVLNEPLSPGTGIGKILPKVGDICIKGTVNVGGYMEYFVLQNTRLSLVMKMADKIVSAITESVSPEPKHTTAVWWKKIIMKLLGGKRAASPGPAA